MNFFRLASVRLAPLDVNVDLALVAALVEAANRVAELAVEVIGGLVDLLGSSLGMLVLCLLCVFVL